MTLDAKVKEEYREKKKRRGCLFVVLVCDVSMHIVYVFTIVIETV